MKYKLITYKTFIGTVRKQFYIINDKFNKYIKNLINIYYVNGKLNNDYDPETFLIYLKVIYDNSNKRKNIIERFKFFK